ncbi:fasciclin-1-like [Glossina fuscipes]|uniref:Fasciclin-1-like n=1 Tax=Glossina fuscipes TaxID=7396 RepID=A0A9C5Z129_9MUSC|nr:fasciclin-1-like [Glossina fuscipes]
MCPRIDSMVSLTPTLVLLGSMLWVKESRAGILTMLDDEVAALFKLMKAYSTSESKLPSTIFVPPEEEVAIVDKFAHYYHTTNFDYRLFNLPPQITSVRKAGPFLYITKVMDDDEDVLRKVFINQAEIKMSLSKYIRDPKKTAGIGYMTDNMARMHVFEKSILFPQATDELYELECRRSREDEEEHETPDEEEGTTEGGETAAKPFSYDEELKCLVGLAYEKQSKQAYVRSVILERGSQYAERSVIVEFAKPNIPVKNGVVHLIKNVLCHINEKVVSAIRNPRITNAKHFSSFVAGLHSKLLENLDRETLLTAFIPINHTNLNEFLSSREGNTMEMKRDTFLRHIVKGRYSSEDIKEKGGEVLITAGMREIPLKFYFVPDPHEKGKELAIVECRGHNTTVELFDMDKENGIVHLVYNVLGFFGGTIYDRLASDEFQSYRDTLRIAEFSGFNEEIKKTNQKYTYFVPSREAWKLIADKYPPAKKHLFMPEFKFQSRYLLERHLVINDEYTAEDLATMTRTVARAIVLPLLRDFLRIKVSRIREEESGKKIVFPTDYLIRYNSLEIKIVHRDIYCSNGIFHVIDSPFLEKDDLTIIREVSSINSNP